MSIKKRNAILAGVLAILVSSLAVGSACAATVTVPKTWTSGDTLNAADLNNDFSTVTNALPGVNFTTINLNNVDVRTAAINAGTVTLNAPAAGYALVRFSGMGCPAAGDRLILAASNVSTTWGVNDGNVEIYGEGTDLCKPFSHSRVYPVPAGTSTFYGVAQNYVETAGSGLATIYATLTVQYFPAKY